MLFGPSAAGGAYIPAFCDVVVMREGNASMYLGSPRMAEMVIGEKGTLEQMGGARMHTGVSGCGHQLVASDAEGIETARRYLSYLPGNWEQQPPAAEPAAPAAPGASIAQLIIGRSFSGSRCLLVIRVSGWRRLPVPPASTTPFKPRPSSSRDYRSGDMGATPPQPPSALTERKRACAPGRSVPNPVQWGTW